MEKDTSSQDEQDEQADEVDETSRIPKSTRTRTYLKAHTRVRGEGRGDLVTRAGVERNRKHTSATAFRDLFSHDVG